jgi:S-adenosylmethionine decarboxylase
MSRKVSARNSGVVVELDQVTGKSGAAFRATEAPLPTTADYDPTSNGKDYFVEKNGLKFAGTHLIIDLWGASNLADSETVTAMLKEAAETCGATLLYMHVHVFSENGGISGVAVLAESHISIHTWPERGYAAVDLFMCGSAEPQKAVPVLRKHFLPEHLQIGEQKRGMVE